MTTQVKTAKCVPVYDRPTNLADGELICHACGQVYVPDGENNQNFCWSCAPAIDVVDADDGALAWTDADVQATLTIIYDNEALAILRMAQV